MTSLYHSPIGLYEFQVEAIAKIVYYLSERDLQSALPIFDTGIGKSHLAMATAGMLYEDDAIDACLFVAEKNKLERDEWPHDLSTFTDLTFNLYHGVPPAKREAMREASPQVLLSTYETIRNDAVRKGEKKKALVPGPLLEWLLTKRSVLIVYDEMTKLGNRGTGLYKAHEFMLKTLRKAGVKVKVLGLTATPIERSPENIFNIGRLQAPNEMPTVAYFNACYINSYDFFGNPKTWKNLSANEMTDVYIEVNKKQVKAVPFADFLKPIVLRKRKTDPDVVDQFPSVVEEPPHFVHLDPKHRQFYDDIIAAFDGADEYEQRKLFTTLRIVAGHPMGLLRSQGAVSKAIAEMVGEEGLRSMGSAKLDRLVERLTPIRDQGDKAVVFTFFANAVLPFIAERLEAEGFDVCINAPFLSDATRSEFKQRFRRGPGEVFLTSDAGTRGINLPEALYIVEYESALTHANRTQRFNRIHRIDSKHPSVTFETLVAFDTVEEGIMGSVLNRNEWSDTLLDDEDTGEDFISAEVRRRWMYAARRQAAAQVA